MTTTPDDAPKTASAWRRWRTARPFWGGLLVVLAGAEILASVRAPLPVVLHVGMQGMFGYLVPILLMVLGVLMWLNPAQRLFYSFVAAVFSLAAWATSNLGGFVVGMLLGLIGSALAFAWAPERRHRTPRHRQTASAIGSGTESDPDTGLGIVHEPEMDPEIDPEIDPRPELDLEPAAELDSELDPAEKK